MKVKKNEGLRGLGDIQEASNEQFYTLLLFTFIAVPPDMTLLVATMSLRIWSTPATVPLEVSQDTSPLKEGSLIEKLLRYGLRETVLSYETFLIV